MADRIAEFFAFARERHSIYLRRYIERQPWLDFSSGYVQRAMASFPKQGSKAPWRLHQNYAMDLMSLRYAKLADGVLEFSNPAKARAKVAA